MKILRVATLALVLAAPVAAQTEGEAAPGYIDFSGLDAVYGEPRVMIDIGGALMKLVAAAAASDPEAGPLMRDLEGVRVRVYDVSGNQQPALARMQEARAALEAAAWEPFVQVKEDGEEVQMFTRIEGDRMQGMAVMVVNAEEAVFLNLLGTIDPAKVGKVMQHLNVGVDGEASP